MLIDQSQVMSVLSCGVGRVLELEQGGALQVLGRTTDGMWLFSLNEVERLRQRLFRARGLPDDVGGRTALREANASGVGCEPWGVTSDHRPPTSDLPALAEGAEYDWEAWTLQVRGRPIELTRIEALIFRELARRPGCLVLQETIVLKVWGPSYEMCPATKALRSNMTRIRAKLRAAGANPHRLIQSRPKLGYVLATRLSMSEPSRLPGF